VTTLSLVEITPSTVKTITDDRCSTRPDYQSF
jgi:hypothetical protein